MHFRMTKNEQKEGIFHWKSSSLPWVAVANASSQPPSGASQGLHLLHIHSRDIKVVKKSIALSTRRSEQLLVGWQVSINFSRASLSWLVHRFSFSNKDTWAHTHMICCFENRIRTGATKKGLRGRWVESTGTPYLLSQTIRCLPLFSR